MKVLLRPQNRSVTQNTWSHRYQIWPYCNCWRGVSQFRAKQRIASIISVRRRKRNLFGRSWNNCPYFSYPALCWCNSRTINSFTLTVSGRKEERKRERKKAYLNHLLFSLPLKAREVLPQQILRAGSHCTNDPLWLTMCSKGPSVPLHVMRWSSPRIRRASP